PEGAQRVVQHAHADAGARARRQCFGEAPPRAVVPDDVVLEVDPPHRVLDQMEHGIERTQAVRVVLQLVAPDGPGARGAVDRRGEHVAVGRGAARQDWGSRDAHTMGWGAGAPAPSAPPAPPRPSVPSTGRSAWITKPTWSSRGTPSSSAPCRTSSRFTPRANALSLSFFFTDETSRSPKLLDGRTSVHATRKPHSSSTANSVRASGVSRGTPV